MKRLSFLSVALLFACAETGLPETGNDEAGAGGRTLPAAARSTLVVHF